MHWEANKELTSSSIRIGAFFSRALAIATLCRSKTGRINHLSLSLSLSLNFITIPVSGLHSVGLHARQQVCHNPFVKNKHSETTQTNRCGRLAYWEDNKPVAVKLWIHEHLLLWLPLSHHPWIHYRLEAHMQYFLQQIPKKEQVPESYIYKLRRRTTINVI